MQIVLVALQQTPSTDLRVYVHKAIQARGVKKLVKVVIRVSNNVLRVTEEDVR